MKKFYPNILLIGGSRRNVGKTTLACQIIHSQKNIIAVKITPHFHSPTEGLQKLSETNDWIIFEETNPKSGKDSALFLKSGATKSFLVQTRKDKMESAFNNLEQFLPKNNSVIIESGGLNETIQPGLFVFIKKEDDEENSLADVQIISNGKQFFNLPEITFQKSWTSRY